jgi:hypothetical protein
MKERKEKTIQIILETLQLRNKMFLEIRDMGDDLLSTPKTSKDPNGQKTETEVKVDDIK